MAEREFKGFGGLFLSADMRGSEDDPSVLLLHGGGQTRHVWQETADALVKAGRHVISLDLRGHGRSARSEDARYEFNACVEDLRAVLAQLASRPVVVGAGLGGWIALTAIGEDGAHLASGLVLADAPPEIDLRTAGALAASIRSTPAQTENVDPVFGEVIDVEKSSERIALAASGLKVPVLFVRGALSSFGNRDAANRFVEKVATAEFAEIEDAGHLAVFDRSDAFSAVLLDFLERRVPRMMPDYKQGSDARTLRDALGCFATGVTVVTTMSTEGKPVGLTANSFTSVSLDPPLLLVCIAKSSSSLEALQTSERFAVNVLHIGQQPVSNTFAMPGEDRFSQTPWQEGQYGSPLISGALANFECIKFDLHDGGDHVILIGKVERAKYEPRRDPLLYFKGKYRRLHFA
ncbi:MAG TPA: alpha/beta fold hydrolase [Henriciella marina]|uniref:alpha/beta fold hydrolase n=1 Tax=Henriciella sp. TaxID=1968823 RepID=UPI001835DD03|nr:alpha/beta fold hydrolase [Henriciella sp.]HIG21872.1 alpha/beta fold hydrolase [Henriciella sp.]HIK64130.1 alpha/beta fold hydrolase [Henriciella marina]